MKPTASYSRWVGLALLIVAALALGVCGAQRAGALRPTRTPKPTYTPTRPVVAQVVVATPRPAPTGAFNTTAGSGRLASQALEATPAPTVTPSPSPSPVVLGRTPSSPEATRVPKHGRAILIDQDRQQLYVFEDGVEIRAIPCSTGNPDGSWTPARSGVVGEYRGTFTSFGTWADNAWFLFQGEAGAIMIHGSPYILHPDGVKDYVDVKALGRDPVSHGCIRIHPEEALWLTFWNPEGVPFIVTRWTGGVALDQANN